MLLNYCLIRGSYVLTGVKFYFPYRFGDVESCLGLAITERDYLILILLVFGDPTLCIVLRLVSFTFKVGVNTHEVLDIAY